MTCSPFDSASLRGRILVVEQPSVFREVQSLVLRGAGYDVANCDDLAAALLTLSRQEFNLVVINSEQPGAHDPEFLLSLRHDRPRLAVIVVVSSITAEQTRQSTRLGVAAVLPSPINPHSLVLKIDQVLGFSLPPGAPKLHTDVPTDARSECRSLPTGRFGDVEGAASVPPVRT